MNTKVILDTDIGYDPDDMFALLLLLHSPELGLDLVVTGDEVEGKRAKFAKKILDLYGYTQIPVVCGEDLGNSDFVVDELIQNYIFEPETDYLGAMKSVIDSADTVVYLGIQGFTNLAKLIETYPECKDKLQVYQMGGAVDYIRRPGWVEHNVKIDKESARNVIFSGVDLCLVVATTTFNPKLEVHKLHPIYQRLVESTNPVHHMLWDHIDLWHKAKGFWTYMHDPLTLSAAMGKDYVSFTSGGVVMDEKGHLHSDDEGQPIKYSAMECKDAPFMQFLEERMFDY